MKKSYYLIVLVLILGLVLAGCSLLSNISQAQATEQSGITYLTKNVLLTGLVLLDSVNIGDLTSESGHDLIGWGPIEPTTSGGAYGSISPGTCRGTWSAYDMNANRTWDTNRDEPWASFTLDAGYPEKLVLRIIDGFGHDSFEVYVNDILVLTYTDQSPTWDNPETWNTHTIDISGLCTGGITVKIESTAPAWNYFDVTSTKGYGQIAVDSAELWGPVPATVDIDHDTLNLKSKINGLLPTSSFQKVMMLN